MCMLIVLTEVVKRPRALEGETALSSVRPVWAEGMRVDLRTLDSGSSSQGSSSRLTPTTRTNLRLLSDDYYRQILCPKAGDARFTILRARLLKLFFGWAGFVGTVTDNLLCFAVDCRVQQVEDSVPGTCEHELVLLAAGELFEQQ